MLVACGRKQDRSSWEARSPPTVYLIYYHPYSDLYSYSVYALEIAGVKNEQTKPLPEPLFRFYQKTSPVAPGFVALDSKIYVIGGEIPFGDRYSLDTYVFDTTKPLPARSKVDDPIDFLIKGPRLNAPKFGPILVTFNGGIYAFPHCFSKRSPPSPKCEMLNVEIGSWIPLPDPPLLDQHVSKYARNQTGSDYMVEGYAVHDSTFVASTPKGIYCLNLSNPTGWRHIQLLGGVSRLPFNDEAVCINEEYFAIVRQKFALCKYDKGLAEEKDLLNLQSGYEYLQCYRHDGVIHLGDNMLCVIRSGLDRRPKSYPPYGSRNFICFDIFQVSEHQKKKKKKKNQSGLAHLASSTFTMDNNLGSYGCPMGCFPKQDGWS